MKRQMAKKSYYEIKVKPKLALVRTWKRNGLSNEEIWNNLGIKSTTFYDYRNKYREFYDALSKDEEFSNAEVENAAFDNATGFLFEEEQVVMKKEIIYENGKRIKETVTPEVIRVTKRKLSDQQAVQWWQKNRLPEKWKDRHEVKNSGSINISYEEALEKVTSSDEY